MLGWGVLWFTVAVILGGSVVRATGSGSGCGESWPRCEGSIFPLDGTVETGIEFTHRAMTTVLTVLLLLLVWRALRVTAPGHPLRRALGWATVFFAGEVVIGAMLVVFGWVDADASIGRVVMVPVHLVNTFLLLGALTVTAHLGSGGSPPRWGDSATRDRLVLAGLVALIVVAASGALNALADTLFPADTLIEGVRREFGRAAPFLVRLRLVHPVVAIGAGLAVIFVVRHPDFDPGRRATGPARVVTIVVAAQFLVGLMNVAMATPVEIQIVHLLAADVLWIWFVLGSARVLALAPAPPVRIARSAAS